MRKFAILWMIMGMLGCSKTDVSDPPKGLISESKMVEVMTELQLADAAANVRIPSDMPQREKQKNLYLQAILNKYQISSQDFWNSYQYYLEKTELMDTVYAQVLTRLDEQLKIEEEKRAKEPQPAPPKAEPTPTPTVLPKMSIRNGKVVTEGAAKK